LQAGDLLDADADMVDTLGPAGILIDSQDRHLNPPLVKLPRVYRFPYAKETMDDA